MRYTIFLVLLIGLALPLTLSAKESPSMNAQSESLTFNQAVAAIHSKSSRLGTTFHVLRELQPSAETRELAHRSQQEASSRHVSLYNDGVFLDLLRNGGFLILEVEPAVDKAVWIHLVSRGANGQVVIDSHEIQGSLKSGEARELISKNADFVYMLLAASPAPTATLESRFTGGRFPEYEEPSEQGFFGVPLGITTLKADQDDVQDLAVLSGNFHLWPIRYAMSLPIYPANPSNALSAARRKHQALVQGFLQKNAKSADFIYDLEDLESIRNVEQLRDRISWFRRINEFLEQVLTAEGRSPEVNRSISTISLQLGSVAVGAGKESLFLAVTSPGLVVAWTRSGDGPWCVARISLAEASDHQEAEAETGF